VQNHLLQLVCILAMDPPVSMDADSINDEKMKVLRSIRPLEPDQIVRGQYEGYREEPGVAPDSDVDTYCALRFEIDSWRWAGVPFTIRAGKGMARTLTEAVVEYVAPPRQLFPDADGTFEPNRMRFRMKPDDLIELSMQVKQPGDRVVMETVDLSVHYSTRLGLPGPAAYERLLGDAIAGPTLDERREDLPGLVERFLAELRDRQNVDAEVTPEAMALLQGRAWPGQVRELRRVIEVTANRLAAERKARGLDAERLVVSADALAEHLAGQSRVLGAEPPAAPPIDAPPTTPQQRRMHPQDITPELARVTLEAHGGNKTHAAQALGVALNTFKKKLKG